MRVLDRTRKTPYPSGGAGGTGGDASPPCPFCGCLNHIEDITTAGSGAHTVRRIRRCCGCGRRFDDREAVCSLCGSPGELLGDLIVPGYGQYVQYRCFGCGNGFMTRMHDNNDTRQA